MDFQDNEPGIDGPEACLDHAAEGVTEAAAIALPRAASEALADPIVQALMAADGLNPRDVEICLRRAAARLAGWKATAAQRRE